MKTASLEILENAELPHAQARAILKVMESEMAFAQDVLATKNDLSAVRSDLKGEIAAVRSELMAEIAAVRGELKAEIAAVRGELMAEIRGVEGRLSRWVLTCILGQTAVLSGLGYFFLAHLGR